MIYIIIIIKYKLCFITYIMIKKLTSYCFGSLAIFSCANNDNSNIVQVNNEHTMMTKNDLEEYKAKIQTKNSDPKFVKMNNYDEQIINILESLDEEDLKKVDYNIIKECYDAASEHLAQILGENIIDFNTNLDNNAKKKIKEHLQDACNAIIDSLGNSAHGLDILIRLIKSDLLYNGHALLQDNEKGIIELINGSKQEWINNEKNKLKFEFLLSLAKNEYIENKKKEQIFKMLKKSNTDYWNQIKMDFIESGLWSDNLCIDLYKISGKEIFDLNDNLNENEKESFKNTVNLLNNEIKEKIQEMTNNLSSFKKALKIYQNYKANEYNNLEQDKQDIFDKHYNKIVENLDNYAKFCEKYSNNSSKSIEDQAYCFVNKNDSCIIEKIDNIIHTIALLSNDAGYKLTHKMNSQTLDAIINKNL